MKRISSALMVFGLIAAGWVAYAWAQGVPIVPTAPFGTNTNQAASTAFVQQAVAAGSGSAPPTITPITAFDTTTSPNVLPFATNGATTGTFTLSGLTAAGATLQVKTSSDGSVTAGVTFTAVPVQIVGAPVGSVTTATTNITTDGVYVVDLTGAANVELSVLSVGSGSVSGSLLLMGGTSQMWLSQLNQTNALLGSFVTNFANRPQGALTRGNAAGTYTANSFWSACPTAGCTGAQVGYYTFNTGTLANQGACRVPGSGVLIPEMVIYSTNGTATTKLQGIVRLFNVQPTASILDGATANISSADLGGLVASVPFALTDAINGSSSAAGAMGADLTNLGIMALCAGTTNLFGVVVVSNAYTAVTNESLTVILKTLSVN